MAFILALMMYEYLVYVLRAVPRLQQRFTQLCHDRLDHLLMYLLHCRHNTLIILQCTSLAKVQQLSIDI
jgi:hypothetical protein